MKYSTRSPLCTCNFHPISIELCPIQTNGLACRLQYNAGSPGWPGARIKLPPTLDCSGGPVTGIITADMRGTERGWFNIKIGEQNQHVDLRALPRHFGGRQWFFLCPRLDRLCTVLWRPPGANYFACRQKWGRQVAYASQFLDRDNRAHRGKARLNSRLCRIGGFNPDDWQFPPKPKWMRWSTYRRAEERFNRYEAMLDDGIIELVEKFKRRGWLK